MTTTFPGQGVNRSPFHRITSAAPPTAPTAPASPTPSTTDPDGVPQGGGRMRNVVGFMVLAFGIGGILWIAYRGVALAGSDNARFGTIFTTLVAVLGGWVSTVLVFYFSRETFQAAQREVSRAVSSVIAGQSSVATAASTPVQTMMVPLEKLMSLKLGQRSDADVALKELCELFTKNPTLTRAPILRSDSSVKYLVHDASFYRFMSDRAIRSADQSRSPIVAAIRLDAVDTADAGYATLETFITHKLDEGDPKSLTMGDVVSVFVTCAPTTTLSDAQSAMVAASAQDAIVTQDGKASSPLMGLLTAEGIGRSASV